MLKYPDIEKRVRKLEKQGAIRNSAVHVAFVHPGEDREKKIAALGPIPPGDQLITVTFVRAADIPSPPTLQ